MAYELKAEYCSPKDISDFLGLYPSKEYQLDQDSGASETNPDRLYVGAKYVPLFNEGDYVRVWDEDNEVGQDCIVYEVGTDYLQLEDDLIDDYETANHAKFRPLSTFTNRSNPSYTEVGNLIKMAQDVIDERTRNSWLSLGRRREEWYNFMPHFRRRFPAFNVLPFTPPDTFWWIRLNYSPVMTFDRNHGDFIRLNMGSSFLDLLDPASGYSEWSNMSTDPRTDGSYWVDYVNGFLFMTTVRPAYTPYAAYIGYRHGEYQLRFDEAAPNYSRSNYVPYDIKRAAVLLVCIDILSRERYALNAPGGDLAGAVDIKRQIDMWSFEVDGIIERHKNMPMMGGGD